ncbi:hypothetical protein NDU88_003666 [Pleurodeles waltl]|uniref:Reverse transcriptase RNase H-like domain-containing protein n=1 Tax=Pleurodeles waltl TaxID=8319 RepID=A0AAV7TP32_PLEWA|nr:hypothetical protein NDU88_003666 [Pleurodeles waltl]
MEKFRHYLWGSDFVLRMDHKPLVKVLTSQGFTKATPHIAKLSFRVLDYVYEVEYLPGKRNKVADYLSRSPLPFQATEDCEWNEYSVAIANVVEDDQANLEGDVINEMEWISAYNSDEDLQKIMGCVRNGWPCKNKMTQNLVKW